MTNTLTKANLTEALSEVTGLPKIEAKNLIEEFFGTISNSLTKGYNVKIGGFGKFSLRDKPARPGRNPVTMEEVEISARRVVTWTPSKKLKERILGNEQQDTEES